MTLPHKICAGDGIFAVAYDSCVSGVIPIILENLIYNDLEISVKVENQIYSHECGKQVDDKTCAKH